MKLGNYKHYKGNMYKVIGLAKHTESEEKLVLYYSLGGSPDLVEEYGKIPYFVRPYKMFNEKIIYNDRETERFCYVGTEK